MAVGNSIGDRVRDLARQRADAAYSGDVRDAEYETEEQRRARVGEAANEAEARRTARNSAARTIEAASGINPMGVLDAARNALGAAVAPPRPAPPSVEDGVRFARGLLGQIGTAAREAVTPQLDFPNPRRDVFNDDARPAAPTAPAAPTPQPQETAPDDGAEPDPIDLGDPSGRKQPVTKPVPARVDNRPAQRAAREQEEADLEDPGAALLEHDERRARRGEEAQFRTDMEAWQARWSTLVAQRQAAIATDDDAGLARITVEMEAHQQAKPRPTLRMTGGLTPEETQEPVEGTLDRLRAVAPKAADALEEHMAQIPDGLNMAYADLSPDERFEAMKRDAENVSSTPQMQVGVQYREPGTGYTTRKPGQPRRIGATEDEKLVPLDQRRFADQDGNRLPMNPDDPNTPENEGRGSMTRVGGGFRPAAPQMTVMDMVGGDASPEGPGAGENPQAWEEKMIAVAVAFGVDVNQFESRGELVRVGQNLLREHQERVKGADIRYNPEGQAYYTPNQASKDTAYKQGMRGDLRAFLQQYPSSEGGDEKQREMMAIVNSDKPDWTRYRELKAQIRQERQLATAQAARDQLRMRGEQQNMSNPRIAGSMLRASLRQASTPEEEANALMQFGEFDEADRVRGREVQRLRAEQEAERDAAEVEALRNRGKEGKEDDLPPEIVGKMEAQAWDQLVSDDGDINTAVSSYMMSLSAAQQAGGPAAPTTQEAGMARFAGFVMGKYGGPLADNMAQNARTMVETVLRRLLNSTVELGDGVVRDRRKAFIDHVVRQTGYVGDPEQIGLWYDRNTAGGQQ